MNNKTIQVDGLFITGKEMKMISGLAIIGAASIMGLAFYGGFKLSEIINDVTHMKEKVTCTTFERD